MKKLIPSYAGFYMLDLLGWQKGVSALSSSPSVRGVTLQEMKLKQDDPSSPYCFAASSIVNLDPSSNFLATQVWPSARVASLEVQTHVSPDWKVVEFGCGPGLPSLTAASMGCSVVATDLDEFALEMVQLAAGEQGLDVITNRFDLIADATDIAQDEIVPAQVDWITEKFDLVLFSDVFENENVARGAAKVTKYFLERGSRVWAFTQSDRYQREAYVEELNRYRLEEVQNSVDKLSFSDAPYDSSKKLWLCDLDETKVMYG